MGSNKKYNPNNMDISVALHFMSPMRLFVYVTVNTDCTTGEDYAADRILTWQAAMRGKDIFMIITRVHLHVKA